MKKIKMYTKIHANIIRHWRKQHDNPVRYERKIILAYICHRNSIGATQVLARA